jgi:predicted Zn-ribbon and HTH transcriptional regulator
MYRGSEVYDMGSYRCTACGYKFQPKTERLPNRCPFCSSPEIKLNETAQDLLNSVGKRQIPDQ